MSLSTGSTSYLFISAVFFVQLNLAQKGSLHFVGLKQSALFFSSLLALFFLSVNIGMVFLSFFLDQETLFIAKRPFAILGCCNLANTAYVPPHPCSSHVLPSWFPHLDPVLSACAFWSEEHLLFCLLLAMTTYSLLMGALPYLFCISLILAASLQLRL